MSRKRHHGAKRVNPLAIERASSPKSLLELVEMVVAAKPSSQKTEDKGIVLTSADRQTIADVATSLWRAKQRTLGTKSEPEISPELRKILRPIKSALDSMARLGVEIQDFTGLPFVQGMALDVISSQPNSALSADRICETLKPGIRFRGESIQGGEVIIEGPPSEKSSPGATRKE